MQTEQLSEALLRRAALVALVSHFRQQHRVDVRQHAALCDRRPTAVCSAYRRSGSPAECGAESCASSYVARRVARQFEHFGREILELCHQTCRCSALRVVAATQQPVNAVHRELQPHLHCATWPSNEPIRPFLDRSLWNKMKYTYLNKKNNCSYSFRRTTELQKDTTTYYKKNC